MRLINMRMVGRTSQTNSCNQVSLRLAHICRLQLVVLTDLRLRPCQPADVACDQGRFTWFFTYLRKSGSPALPLTPLSPSPGYVRLRYRVKNAVIWLSRSFITHQGYDREKEKRHICPHRKNWAIGGSVRLAKITCSSFTCNINVFEHSVH